MTRVWLRVAKFIFSILRYFTSISPQDAGERQTYHLTSDAYGPGSYRVSKSSDIVPSNDALTAYRESGWVQKIQDFTIATWDKALTSASHRA